MTPMLGIMASQISGHLSPTSPVAGYKVWLDAADTGTITSSGGAVSQWTDKSGNAYTFTQATAAYKPTTGTQTQNGKNVLAWDSNDLLVSTAAASVWKFLNYGSGSTYFIAAKHTATSSYGGVITTNGGSTQEKGVLKWFRSSDNYGEQVATGTSGVYAVSNNTASSSYDGAFTYISSVTIPNDATAANRSSIQFKQGSAIKNNTETAAAPNNDPGFTLYLGDYATAGGLAMQGTIGEILMYDSVLSAGNILLNQQYLAAKWGV